MLHPDTIFARTRTGILALAGQSTPLSGGFRQLLGLLDGKRAARDILKEMPHLDEEDLTLWTDELVRQGLIAQKDAVPVEEMAFSITTELPAGAFNAANFSAGVVISDIVADVTRSLGGAVDAQTGQLLRTTGRMAALEAKRSHPALGRSGFFVYPHASAGLPQTPRVCIAGHLAAQNRLLEILFVRAGIKPSIVATRDALRTTLADVFKPHILVVDAQMPMLDAFRTLDAMRADAALQKVRMVVVSDRGERGDLAQAMMMGATAYIVKPLRKEVLDAALPQILGRPLA
jgi:CheY-like chemotaxis protein